MSPAYRHLSHTWEYRESRVKERIVSKHKPFLEWLKQNVTHALAGSLGSLILFAFPVSPPTSHLALTVNSEISFAKELDKGVLLMANLSPYIPQQVQPLDSASEKHIATILSRSFQLDVTQDIHGMRLDRTYGYIGAEQHLARFPGDTMSSHFVNEGEANQFSRSGMAPGLGAWGYFADAKETMTQEDSDREKYYVAVQTFLAQHFTERFPDYRDFFKYRKLLIVNPNNGRAVVADIADSGPAVWTRKHLGGSPEVMNYLVRVDGSQKGGVIYFFVNDPRNKVPLGPITPVQ